MVVKTSLMGAMMAVFAPIFGIIVDNTEAYQGGYLFVLSITIIG